MMTLTTRYPAAFAAVRDMDSLMSSILGADALGASAQQANRRLSSFEHARVGLPIALREDAQNIYLDADLPGVKLDDVDITLDRGTLTLRATRQLPIGQGQELRHSERFKGELVRAVTLGRSIDTERVSAEMREGVLTVTLPKVSDQTGRKIAVRPASAG